MNFGHRVFIVKYPTGRFGFVGHVPVNLSFTMKDGSPVTPEAARVAVQCGTGYANVKPRTLDSQQAAEDDLTQKGYVKNPPAADPTSDTGWSWAAK